MRSKEQLVRYNCITQPVEDASTCSRTVSLLRPTTVISSFHADDAANMEKMPPGHRRHWLDKENPEIGY
jgi:hypothetical protein